MMHQAAPIFGIVLFAGTVAPALTALPACSRRWQAKS